MKRWGIVFIITPIEKKNAKVRRERGMSSPTCCSKLTFVSLESAESGPTGRTTFDCLLCSSVTIRDAETAATLSFSHMYDCKDCPEESFGMLKEH